MPSTIIIFVSHMYYIVGFWGSLMEMQHLLSSEVCSDCLVKSTVRDWRLHGSSLYWEIWSNLDSAKTALYL